MQPSLTTGLIASAVEYLHERFDELGIWHCLTYGTLLGAIRDGDYIAWDYDFDFFVRPSDVPRILALNGELAADGYAVERMWIYASLLAVNPRRIDATLGCAVGVFHRGMKIGDLYAYPLFSDGILRRFDVQHGVYWMPHSSVPHFFFERLDTATLRGVRYPIPQHADRFIAGVYGDDWRTPYRAVRQGGTIREGVTTYGDRYEPKLRAEVDWCVAHGWDRDQYRFERTWPRDVLAAGPLGPTERTRDSSQALWWRSRAELLEYF